MLSKNKEKHLLQAYFKTKNNKKLPSYLPQFGVPDGDTTDEELFFITKYVAAIDKVFLRNSFVTEAGLLLLKKLEKVRCLDLRGMPLHDGNLECVLHLTALEFLDVSHTKISSQGLYQLLMSLPNLQTFIAEISQNQADLQKKWQTEFPLCEFIIGFTTNNSTSK